MGEIEVFSIQSRHTHPEIEFILLLTHCPIHSSLFISFHFDLLYVYVQISSDHLQN